MAIPESQADGRSQGQRPGFDSEERTAQFGEAVIKCCLTMPKTVVTEPLIRQIIRPAASVGSDDCEADEAVPRKEFRRKIGIREKEAR